MVRDERPDLRLLSDEGVDRIVGGALATLERVGVRVESPEAVELLARRRLSPCRTGR